MMRPSTLAALLLVALVGCDRIDFIECRAACGPALIKTWTETQCLCSEQMDPKGCRFDEKSGGKVTFVCESEIGDTSGVKLGEYVPGELPYCDQIVPFPVQEITDEHGNKVTVQSGQPCQWRDERQRQAFQSAGPEQ